MTTKVTIIWRNEDSEPLVATVEACYPELGFLCLEFPEDILRPGVDNKTLMYPSDMIHSVTVEELADVDEKSGYREGNTFREQPPKSPWFRGMGRRGSNDGR